MDNLDEQTFQGFLARLPLRSARFVAISKSGSTGETLLQAIGVIDALRASGVKGKLGRFILGLSEPRREGKANNLRDLLEAEGAAFLDHHTGVGGRFSVLTNVGLLAAAFAGIDIRAIRRGAASAVAAVIAGDASPAAEGAALNLAAMREGRNIAVLMGYGDRFERLTRWWVQLWAESLGKSGMGSQPVAALGPVDQHSQQQLYLAGPRDKLFTVLTVAPRRAAPKVSPVRARQAGEPGFAGRSIDQFVAAQSRAMIDTFAANGCPVRHIHLARLDAAVLGDLAMHFMLETILTGYAMGIDPFDQPAVEEAKLLAKRYLGEAG
jgi:glucose-6-phosphate isomerase